MAVVKTPTVISNNPVLRHWHVVHRQGIFPHSGILIFNYYFFSIHRVPEILPFLQVHRQKFCVHFSSFPIILSYVPLSQVRGPVRHIPCTIRVSPSPDHRTLLDGLDVIATVGIKERPKASKFTWRIISLLQNSRTSVGQS